MVGLRLDHRFMIRNLTFIFFFISTSLHFLFPQFVVLLNEAHIGTEVASLILSSSMLGCAFVLPIAGYLLDRGYFTVVLATACGLILLGLTGYSLAGKTDLTVVSGLLICFILGTAIIYSAARRITEGLSKDIWKLRSISLTYMVENLGITVSAVIAMKWLNQYRDFLIYLDGISTFLFCLFLVYASKKLSKVITPSELSTQSQLKQSSHQFKNASLLVAISIPVLTICFLHLSTLQTYFIEHSTVASATVGKLFFVNTLSVVAWIFLTTQLNISKKFSESPQKTFFFGCLLTAAGLLINIFYVNDLGLIGGTMIWSVGEALLLPIIAMWILKAFPSDRQGLAVGFKDLTFRLALIASPLFTLFLNLKTPEHLAVIIISLTLISIFSMQALRALKVLK